MLFYPVSKKDALIPFFIERWNLFLHPFRFRGWGEGGLWLLWPTEYSGCDMARFLRLDFKKLDNFPWVFWNKRSKPRGKPTTMKEYNQPPWDYHALSKPMLTTGRSQREREMPNQSPDIPDITGQATDPWVKKLKHNSSFGCQLTAIPWGNPSGNDPVVPIKTVEWLGILINGCFALQSFRVGCCAEIK